MMTLVNEKDRWLGAYLLRGMAVVCLLCALPGCLPPLPAPPDDASGLKASDFKQINLNGFDPEDQAIDKNDYAWAMEYFQPDGAAVGRVYVATGNDMLGLMFQGMTAMLGGGNLGDVKVRPPEIRRYREDLGPLNWERVFDYREIETEPNFTTIGFRHIKAYRAQSDGVNYLYAATYGREATVLRTATGEPNSWSAVWTSGAIGSVRMMETHNGILYLALSNDTPEGERLGKIWATDGSTFWPVVLDGFGNPQNTGVMSLISWNGWLYAGTQNEVTGFEIWKLAGPNGSDGPIKVVGNGGSSWINEGAITPCVFNGKLYMGSQLLMHHAVMRGFQSADIIRIDENDNWETVVGPHSLSRYGSGFNRWTNIYIWAMAVHDGWLYASTYDMTSSFTNLFENFPELVKDLMPRAKRANFFELVYGGGADLYKTQDGVTWVPVTLDGFGDPANYGFRTMASVGNALYLGTANPADGCEIWRAASGQ